MTSTDQPSGKAFNLVLYPLIAVSAISRGSTADSVEVNRSFPWPRPGSVVTLQGEPSIFARLVQNGSVVAALFFGRDGRVEEIRTTMT